jgi:hypothetical protein
MMTTKAVARRAYYLKNREKELLLAKIWRENNPEKVRALSKKWRKNNPKKIREYTEKYSLEKKEKEWENTLIELGYGDLYKSC